MCDYSLMGIPNRLAKEGEDLVVYKFRTGTLGFTSMAEGAGCAEPQGFWQSLKKILLTGGNSLPAVCVPPGARLALKEIPERLQVKLNVGPTEEVTFTQLSYEPHQHRDAVRFDNGRVVRLQELRTGIGAQVLDLSGAERRETMTDDFGVEIPLRI